MFHIRLKRALIYYLRIVGGLPVSNGRRSSINSVGRPRRSRAADCEALPCRRPSNNAVASRWPGCPVSHDRSAGRSGHGRLTKSDPKASARPTRRNLGHMSASCRSSLPISGTGLVHELLSFDMNSHSDYRVGQKAWPLCFTAYNSICTKFGKILSHFILNIKL